MSLTSVDAELYCGGTDSTSSSTILSGFKDQGTFRPDLRGALIWIWFFPTNGPSARGIWNWPSWIVPPVAGPVLPSVGKNVIRTSLNSIQLDDVSCFDPGQRPPKIQIDGMLDIPHAPVRQEDLYAPSMHTAWCWPTT